MWHMNENNSGPYIGRLSSFRNFFLSSSCALGWGVPDEVVSTVFVLSSCSRAFCELVGPVRFAMLVAFGDPKVLVCIAGKL